MKGEQRHPKRIFSGETRERMREKMRRQDEQISILNMNLECEFEFKGFQMLKLSRCLPSNFSHKIVKRMQNLIIRRSIVVSAGRIKEPICQIAKLYIPDALLLKMRMTHLPWTPYIPPG